MALDRDSLRILARALEKLNAGFSQLPQTTDAVPGGERMEEVMLALAEKLQNNYPYFHPLYAGQMLKPPHPVARLAYSLAMYINPNNHALDGGRATSALEKEAVANIAAMFGWKEFLGHLCGGGTMANLEALWVAGQIHPGKKILASDQAHYTHGRISGVLQLPFEIVEANSLGQLDVEVLARRLARGDVGTVVATLGTTATGSVDSLPEIQELRQKYGFRVHVDAAYGGYFALASNLAENAHKSFARIGEADSIVIDPHKHGLQPYGCGCVLFRDPGVGKLYRHDSPYTYFSSAELHLGEISLECSRAGAAAAALWATQKLLPLERDGEFARGLERGRDAALQFARALERGGRFMPAFEPELDIVAFVPKGNSLKEISEKSRRIFDTTARRGLHLALAELPARSWRQWRGEQAASGAWRASSGITSETVTCLRSVLMKPEHLDWVAQIVETLDSSSDG
jgi:tyrosine decarboxylase / aspartate 1-decarboxylase